MNRLNKIFVFSLTLGYFLNVFAINVLADYDPKYPWETPWYIPNSSTTCSSDNINLIGSDNLEKIYNYFIMKGLDPIQAAGIAGNAQQESTSNPESVSKLGYRGIFQWDPDGRYPSLVAWATEKNLNPNELSTQLEYAYFEITPGGGTRSYVFEEIKTQPTVELATWYWGRYFEGAVIDGNLSEEPLTNVQELDKRTGYAKGVLSLYGSSFSNQSVSSSSSCSGGNGQYTQYKDNFVIYKQYDPQWENHPFGTSTLKPSGCGPTSMAMIVSTFLGRQVLPTEIADFGTQNNLYEPGQGVKHALFPMVAEKYGLKSEKITADIPSITNALRNGGLVITIGSGAEPYTPNGHVVVIRAITPEGKWLVGDSGHNNTDTIPYDPQDIINGIKQGVAYGFAIYK